jgi:hypothetical protein
MLATTLDKPAAAQGGTLCLVVVRWYTTGPLRRLEVS